MLPFFITQTLASIKLNVEQYTKVTPVYNLDTTLNYKYSVFADEIPVGSVSAKYFSVGTNGNRYVNTQNGLINYIPKATNMDLFSPLPFRCVPITADLSIAERANYRMRVLTIIDGINHFCYYLKLLNYTSPNVSITMTDKETNIEEDYILDNSNLNPIPDEMSGITITENKLEGNVFASCQMEITANEIAEAVGILYQGDVSKNLISEIGIVSGVDKIVTSPVDGVSYTEAIYAQLNSHRTFSPVDLSIPGTVYMSNIELIASSNFII